MENLSITQTQSHLDQLLDSLGLTATWNSLVSNLSRSSGVADASEILQAFAPAAADVPDLLSSLTYQEISELYEYSLARCSPGSRKDAGQYFTPNDVGEFMAKLALAGDTGADWLDPCCGPGQLSYCLASASKDPAAFLRDRLILSDLDELAIKVAAALLVIFLAPSRKGIFRKLRSRERLGDYLDSSFNERHQVIMNPPYRVSPSLPDWDTGNCRETYAYFIEQATKNSDRIVVICPQSFTNGTKFAPLRDLIRRNFNQLDIYCFDNVPDNIFKGKKHGAINSNKVNSTRAAVFVGTRSIRGSKRITPLLRWQSKERKCLLDNSSKFLGVIQANENSFPKLFPQHIPLYKWVTKNGLTLSDLMDDSESRFVLYVPGTPRYFLSATRRHLSRTSIRQIYFSSAETRDLAYILLNSSLSYWWWRVQDGGMSLSLNTLRTIPLPPGLRTSQPLVRRLLASEKANLVVKNNAGKGNENVKHPDQLIFQLDQLIVPQFAEVLAPIRLNSSLQVASALEALQ